MKIPKQIKFAPALIAANPLGTISAPGGIGGSPGALGSFLSTLVNFLIAAGFIIAFILLIIGGIQYMTAGGDKQAATNARGRIFAAIVGLLIILASFAIIRLVEDFFGFKFFSRGIEIQPIQ